MAEYNSQWTGAQIDEAIGDVRSNKDAWNNNTTYSLSKSGSTITLTGSDGSSTSVTDVNTTYSEATQSASGLLGSTDKKKLDSVANGAEVNQNAFSNVAVGSTTIAADSKTDTLTLVAGNNVTITPDATNDKITIAASDTVYTHPASHPASMITGLATVATSGEYSDLTGKPTIPTKTSQLTNDSGFKTTDNNTTYSLSKSGSTITLTGSDGSSTSVTDSDTTYTLPAAGSSLGGVKTGGDVTISDGVITVTTASKLGTNAGSATNPVYFSNGVPVKTTYTLGASVPSGAKFTDTTYSAATSSAAGLMPAADKKRMDSTVAHYYGECSTASTDATKVVTIDNFELSVGVQVTIKFANASGTDAEGDALTLNVNGTGAFPMRRYGTTAMGTATTTSGWTAGAIQTFTYDGAAWVREFWYNTTYSNVSLGQGYATCSTAAATTAKTASLSSYSLTTGGIVAVRFTYDVPAGATLNINSKGAKAIYYRNAAITAGVIKAGDIATFVYSTYYRLISIDRGMTTLSDLGVTATAAELNYVDGVTSNIQTQLDSKQATITGGATTITSSNLTASRALVSDSSGKVAVSAVTSTELGYLDGVTSNVQTQLNNKQDKIAVSGILKGNGSTVSAAVRGTDYVHPDDLGDIGGPSTATALPSSGTALTNNTVYHVTAAVTTYNFVGPSSGWAHGYFSTGSSVSVSFSGQFLGAAPTIGASKAYEFDVFDGIWAVQEVVSA